MYGILDSSTPKVSLSNHDEQSVNTMWYNFCIMLGVQVWYPLNYYSLLNCGYATLIMVHQNPKLTHYLLELHGHSIYVKV